MELHEIIQKKLADFKKTVIAITSKDGDAEIKKWGNDWSSVALTPPPFAFFIIRATKSTLAPALKIDFSTLWNVLNAFEKAHANFESGNYEASLEFLFSIASLLGSRAGIAEERKRKTALQSRGKHLTKKLEVIQYYIDNPDLHNFPYPKAAEEIEKRCGTQLKWETIYRYLLEYERHSEKIKKYMPSFRSGIEDFISNTKAMNIGGEELRPPLPDELDRFMDEHAKTLLNDLISKSPI